MRSVIVAHPNQRKLQLTARLHQGWRPLATHGDRKTQSLFRGLGAYLIERLLRIAEKRSLNRNVVRRESDVSASASVAPPSSRRPRRGCEGPSGAIQTAPPTTPKSD
jgi:hypothetical protein